MRKKNKHEHDDETCSMCEFKKMFEKKASKEDFLEIVGDDLKLMGNLFRKNKIKIPKELEVDSNQLESSLYFAWMFLNWKIGDEIYGNDTQYGNDTHSLAHEQEKATKH